MTKKEVDLYLSKVPEPQRSTLKELRKLIRAALPKAEECLSYNMPAYKVEGQVIAGFASAKKHCSYYPFSGRTLATLSAEVSKYVTTKGSLHFAVDKCIPATLVNKLVKTRIKEVEAKLDGGI
ncbi:MAG: DUF1801 domain-containing protein [Candidatus Nanopelagicaceae bacterium]|nr:DUF1801 domain-containing protein [Candidatus Nanopelagicaceae bacterium]